MAEACRVEPVAIVVDSTRAIYNLVAPVAIHITYAEIMVPLP